MKNLHLFSESGSPADKELLPKIGIRGRRAFELASLHMPMTPGFILDSDGVRNIDELNIDELVKTGIQHIEEKTKKKFGNKENPLFLKILCSSNMRIAGKYPSLHNVGLNSATIASLASYTSKDFANNEALYLTYNFATKLMGVDKKALPKISNTKKVTDADLEKMRAGIPEGSGVPDDVFQSVKDIIIKMAKQFSDPDDSEDELSVLVQAMVYGNYSGDSLAGQFYTRNIVNGDAEISGSFAKNDFDIKNDDSDILIENLDDKYQKQLSDISVSIEEHFKDIRFVKFTVEAGKLWFLEQRVVDGKSTRATIKNYLSLLDKKIVDEEFVISNIAPAHLNELLHPVIDEGSAKKVPFVSGGLAGSSGAATGRVFFSTKKLVLAHRDATLKGEDPRMILCLNASYAEDVKAIEICQGVLTAEGGYASHAPVVARSLGKISLVNGKMKIGMSREKVPFFKLGKHVVKEGDYITLDVPFYKDPEIYFDKVDLIQPDIESNGLIDFLKVADSKIDHDKFTVRANADLGRDAKLAKSFGAKGIGLCRTEHMFFAEDRINLFREMILADDEKSRREKLKVLEPHQINDFYDLFKTMHPYPVTIRLLDAPLHEFLPRNKQIFNSYIKHLKSSSSKAVDRKALENKIERMAEVNPMLGHRGCRVAITYPEIYEMQISAIFKASQKLALEGFEVKPEIMIPIVMNEAELKFIRKGKKIEGKSIPGIMDIEKTVRESLGGKEISYRVGTMVELPAAALSSDSLAKYADFFSFGTNDLTQTTYGLSRDDSSSFFPVYTEYDLLKNNPFQVLGKAVKEMISIAVKRGRLTRPDLKLGLCGEHGADVESIKFCHSLGLNYVSTSPYSVPIAILAVAHICLGVDK